MPSIFEYLGILIFFYSNEHEPVHVHGTYQGHETRAEIIVVNGLVQQITYSPTVGRAPLPSVQQRYFEELVESRADAIVGKWIDFFVLNKPVQSESITRRIK
jgi:hypothetical protein